MDYTDARRRYRERQAELAPAPKAKSKGRGKGRGRAGAVVRTVIPYVQNPADGMPQAFFRDMCPPGAHIWRDNVRGAWHVHLPPWRRFHRPFNVYGEAGAGVEAIREAWRLHHRDAGTDPASCPIEGLFDGAA